MNEIKTIHLGRTAFTVAVDAYGTLQGYLADIRKRAGKEVAEEVELRMAELLLERGFDDKKVILASEVSFLRQQLGEPSDFADDAAPSDDEPTDATDSKRLYRDTSHGWFGGVSAGLASYLGLPAWVIRLAFVALATAGFSGVLIYLLFWILVPDAKTPSDHLRMQGKAVTVDTIKEYVLKNPGINEMKQKAGSVLDGSWQASPAGSRVGRAIAQVVKFCLALAGAGVLVAGLAGALGTIGVGSYVVSNPDKLFEAGRLFPIGSAETWLLVLSLFVALLVCVLMSMIGLTLIRRRWPVPGWVTAVLVAFVLVGGAVATSGAFAVAPKVVDRYNAAKQTTVRSVSAFTSLTVSGENTDVEYQPGDSYQVMVTTVGKLDQAATTSTVKDGTLNVTTTNTRNHGGCSLFCIRTENVHIIVRAPHLDTISVSNDASVAINQQLKQSDLTVMSDDSSNFTAGYIYPKQADFTFNGSRRTAHFIGLQPASPSDTAEYNSFDAPIYLTRADSVTFSSDSTCDEGDTRLVVTQVNGPIQVGTQQYPDATALVRAHHGEMSNAANCIDAVPLPPAVPLLPRR